MASAKECPCCGMARGYVYTSGFYARGEIETICPWCIADGSLAAKFDAILVEDFPLRKAGLPEDVIEEVTRRTPGYTSLR